MFGQVGPSFGVSSSSLPAILIGVVTMYLVVSLAQREGPFRTARTESGPPPSPVRAENPALRALYALAVAALVVAFVGFGIEAIYPTPEPPQPTTPFPKEIPPAMEPGEPPPPPVLPELPGSEPPGGVGGYERELVEHNRVSSVVAIAVAVLILIANLIVGLGRRLPIIGEGVTLGGVLTLLYGIYLGIQVRSGWLTFSVVVVSLLALLVVLYREFRRGRAVGPDRTAGS